MRANTIILPLMFFAMIGLAYAEESRIKTIYAQDIIFFKNDTARLGTNIVSEQGMVSDFTADETYLIRVLSGDGQELFKGGLIVSFYSTEPSFGEYDNVTLYEVRVPYYPTAKYIAVSHLNNTLLSVDLSKEFCNKDQACDLGENEVNCLDCVKTEPQEPIDNENPPGGENPPEVPPKSLLETYGWIIPLIGVLVILIVVYIFLKKRTAKSKEETAWQAAYDGAPTNPQVSSNP